MKKLLLLLTSLLTGLSFQPSLRADVEIFKSIENDLTEVETGESFIYKLQYRAASTTTNFDNATLTDILPAGLEYQELVGTIHVDNDNFDAVTRTLSVNFVDPLPAGSTGEITLKVRFKPGSTPDGTAATNTATMDADNSPASTSTPVSITARASNRATLEKQLLGSGIPIDQDVTYRIRVRNQHTVGALDLTTISVSDSLPVGALFVSASNGGIYSPGAHTVDWTVGDLDAGQTATRTVTVRYPAPAFTIGGSVTNDVSATVTPVGGTATTLTDSVTHIIESPSSDLVFAKGVDGRFVYEGKEANKTWNLSLRNQGNVPVDMVSVIDTVPDQVDITSIRVPRLQGTPEGLEDPVSVYIQTSNGGGWSALLGNPFSGSTSEWVNVSSLGLPVGEYVTQIRWDFGTLPVGYEARDFSVRGTILTVDRNGDPVPVGFVVENTASVLYTDFNGPQSDTNDAGITIKTVRPVAELEKAVSPSNVNDGDNVTYTIVLENRQEAAEALENPVLADLLSEKLEYVPGSWQILSKPAGAPDPVFVAITDYNSTGRTLLRWVWQGPADYDLPIGESFRISFVANVPSGTIFGNIDNRIYLADWGNSEIDTYNGVSTVADSDDLDGDGNTTEEIHYENRGAFVRGRASMESVKFVKGQLDSDWSKYPDSGFTVPGGLADYRLEVENTGNIPITDAQILDILPVIGDTGVIDLSSRDTEWIASLAGPVVAPPGVTVYYSRYSNPERPDFKSGVPAAIPAEWTTTPPATLPETRSLLFVFDGITIQPGEKLELTWPMRAPVGTPTDGRIAWNSFGYFGTRVDTDSELLASEPIKVGIAVAPDNNASYGDRVWLDTNKDGIQDAGEIGLNGIRVDFYEDGPVGGFGDGVRDPSTDRYVGFTVTANNFAGEPGYYLFPDLDRGDYYAVFTLPDGYTVTTKDAGLDDELDSDVDSATGFTPITDIAALENDRSWDLGLWLPPTSVSVVKTAGTAVDGDNLWILPGTPVTYTYVVTNTGDLPLVRIRVTDDVLGLIDVIDGPLAPGASTTVTKTSPSLSSGVVNIGAVEGHPASPGGIEIPGAPPVTDDDPASVSVFASLGDYVWYDINLNGIQDSGESPVSGVLVTLYDALGNPIATDTTGSNGRYLFPGLFPGDYSVGFTPPAGYVLSDPDQGGNDGNDSDANRTTGRTTLTTLVAGEQDRSWDAGLWRPASLGDYVWLDLDSDGIQDPSEPGVNGITVNLLDNSGNPILDAGGSPLTTTTSAGTGGDGFYEFTGLIPASYQVEFVLPITYIFSPSNADSAGINGTSNSDADEISGRTAPVSLANGEHNPRIDAGLIPANPSIALTKSVTPTEYDTDGQSLAYTFIVENTGNVPLTNVLVTDPLFSVVGGPINLAVGETDSITFSGTYAVTLGDLNNGSRPNIASVTATDPRTGDPVTDSDPALATALQLPALSISKTGTFLLGPGPCQPLGLGNEFNALIFGNLNASGGDTDARLAVGGNATIVGGYSVGTVVKGDSLPIFTGGTCDMFIVGGDLTDGSWGVNGNVVYSGTRTGPVRVMPNGNLTRQVIPITFDDDGNVPSNGSGMTFGELADEMEVRSALLGSFGERGVISKTETTVSSGVVGLELVGNDPELNVFHLTAAEISLSSASFGISVPAGSITLVNVYGDPVAIHNVGMTLNGTNPRRVLFNLVDATSVETSGFAWLGSVLAPYASGDFTGGSIDGRSVFGGDVTTRGGFEFHNFPFAGGICFEIEYEFTVTNTGNVTVTGITIDDPVVSVGGGPISLNPGESDSSTFTATYLLKATDVINGAFTNTATVSGQPPFGARVAAIDSDTQTFTIPGIGSGGTSGSGGAPSVGGTPGETTSNGEEPDLQVNSVTFIAQSEVTGDSFSAVIEVENKGLWKANGAVLRFWNDKPTAATVGEAGEAEVHLGIMEIDEIRTITVSGFTAPATGGTYFLRVFADADGTVDEQSEANNQLTGTYTVIAPTSANPPSWMKPDFVVQSVRLDPSPTLTSAIFDVVVRITNTGHISGNAGKLSLWEKSPSYNSLAATEDQSTSVGVVNVGDVVEITFAGIRAPDDQGTYHVRVIVDVDGTTEEYSVGNNHGGATYTVFPLQAVIEPHPSGMSISWNSADGYTYYVERSTSLTGGWVDISGSLLSTPPTNIFIDDDVPSGGAVFYRVWGTR